MINSEKPTINVRNDEVELLDRIRRLAPQFGVPPHRAEIYGVWTICYQRFCKNKDIPVVWMDSVSDFMDFLRSHSTLSDPERNQALDAVMFFLTDIRHAEDANEVDEVESFPRPTSANSLFAHLLLRCDIEVEQALKLRVQDIDLDDGTLHVEDDKGKRTIQLLPSLRSGMRVHLKRIAKRTDATNPQLFGPDAPASRSLASFPDVDDEDVEHATQIATRVMKTITATSPPTKQPNKNTKDDEK